MEGFQPFIFAFLGVLSLILLLVHAQDQSGFISIDCGLPADSTYKEPTTSLDYISDANFIDTGISRSVVSELKATIPQPLWNVRSFPQGVRNCYTIKITRGTIYLIRGTFLYGNYDGEGNLPEFDLYLGTNMWDTVKVENASDCIIKELIHVPSRNYIHVCLVNRTGRGTPFISAIEFRPLNNGSYETKYGSLALFLRADTGSTGNQSYRYPDDARDRIWTPYNRNEWKYLSTDQHINRISQADYQPASVVMSTAATPINESAPMELYWQADNPNTKFFFKMHFTEVVKLEPNQSRSFTTLLNGEYWDGPYVPGYLSIRTVYSDPLPPVGSTYNISMFKEENSTLPPILNAFEIYFVKDFLQPETERADVDAIRKIKSTYGIKRNWQGDPCAPKKYLWEGLDCSYDADNAPRITSLNLSSSGLTGEISADTSNFLMLQSLDLSNNSLTGSVPNFLSKLTNLRVLNLERNKLTGSVPRELIERRDNDLLSLSVGENPDLCESRSCKKKKNNIVIPIASVGGGLLIFTFIVMAIYWGIRKRTKQGMVAKSSIKTKSRQYSYSEVVSITNDFKTIIGGGGFGNVYLGTLEEDTKVAVKFLRPSSNQGYKEFQAEAQLLTIVHHQNLVSLVGYCDEDGNKALIYEYMANGNLLQHLSGTNANILSWNERLHIAVDAAHGLEYLHNGCKPSIIHRDLKPSNILLNDHMQAKIADFGLSRAFATDSDSHVSTGLAGTIGYLDPRSHATGNSNKKNDVYSFGIILFELISGRPAIIRGSMEDTHILKWVIPLIERGDIQNIVDPRLEGEFNTNSAWKAAEIAMFCTLPTAIQRPDMSQVSIELKECLDLLMAHGRSQKFNIEGRTSGLSLEAIPVDLESDIAALAR
ncbi:hypothetical protein I3842_02G140800 [Carya illinoinensis]|uniref:Protein kinase domain-containing protein n=1 Tax=Carya illinoinensis TaxID=32201 RepID=A0A922K0Y3_CARIL|nr:hypothetical protein I3842_02G140800 [Carya illinoinensis]